MALQPTDIERILSDVASKLRGKLKGADLKVDIDPDTGMPRRAELWPGFNDACNERHGLLPHIEHGHYPGPLFAARAPNETKEEADYIRKNFRQTTLTVYSQFENTILRALAAENMQVDYDVIADNTQRERYAEYVEKGVPMVGSVSGYLQYVLPKCKTSDAMGLVAMMPQIPVVMNDEGSPVVDPDRNVTGKPIYVPVDDLWAWEAGQYYLWRSNETTPEGGLVMWLVDDSAYYKVIQPDKTVVAFVPAEYYRHDTGMVMAHLLMGVPYVYGENIRWQSPYMAVKPVLDTVLLDNSYLGLSKATGVFPYRVQLSDPCAFVAPDGTHCNGTGQLYHYEGDKIASVTKCPSCDGSGRKSRLSPAGVLLVDPSDSKEYGIKPSDAIHWSEPGITTLDFLEKAIERNIREALSIMHLSSARPMEGGEQETATKSGIDLRAMMAFIRPIADQYYDLYEFMLTANGRLMFDANFPEITVRRPTSFDIRTEADMLTELQTAYESNLPQPVLDRMITAYLQTRYGTDPGMMAAIDVIAAADDLFSLTMQQVQYQLSQKLIEPWRVVLHYAAMPIYDRLLRENRLPQDTTAAVAAMQEEAKAIMPQGGTASSVRDIMGALRANAA